MPWYFWVLIGIAVACVGILAVFVIALGIMHRHPERANRNYGTALDNNPDMR